MRATAISGTLIVVLTLGLWVGRSPNVEGAVAWQIEPAAFFSDADFDRIAADKMQVIDLYAERSDAFREALNIPGTMATDEIGMRAIFSSMLAHAFRPYGNAAGLDFDELLTRPVLDCDNYSALLAHFFGTLAPGHRDRLTIVGWNSGAVGNHAQVFYASPTMDALMDPTTGLIALGADFDTVARGIPIPADAIFEMPARPGELERFKLMVRNAIIDGSYRPSDLMYFYAGIEDMMSGNMSHWSTPQAAIIREHYRN